MQALTGVLVHRVTRPLRGSVSCGSGWSVPCVSIQLTLSQNSKPLEGPRTPLQRYNSRTRSGAGPGYEISLTRSLKAQIAPPGRRRPLSPTALHVAALSASLTWRIFISQELSWGKRVGVGLGLGGSSRWYLVGGPKPDQLAPNERPQTSPQRSGIGPKPQARRAHPLSCSSRSTWRRPRDARAPKGA